MKRVFLAVVAIFISAAALHAQENILKKLEAADPQSGGRVVVNNHVSLSMEAPDRKVAGYRIRIFSSNAQDARSKAFAVEQTFSQKYPNIPVSVNFKSPDYRVTAGACLVHEEAVMLLATLLSDYPNAYIVTESFPISLFGDTRKNAANDYASEETTDTVPTESE